MKKIQITFVLLSALVVFGNKAYAQADVTISGTGRSILTGNQLSGSILENDTASSRKGLSGYNLFDMGVGFSKGRELRSNVILRLRQPWGEFWGETTPFEFRQFQVMGDLKWLSYELGDIDVKMTPYTVYNNNEIFSTYESNIFRMRRDIVEYENFNKGNVWRLQGIKLGSGLYMENFYFKEINIRAFGVRTNVTDDVTMPDRILAGGSLYGIRNEKVTLGVNYVGLLDVPLDEFATNYRNNVITGEANIRLIDKDNFKLNILGEGGISDYRNYKKSVDTTASAQDFFIDGGVKAQIKGIRVKVSYKNVGLKYSSPSAQTVRVNVNQSNMLFANVYNNTTARSQVLFDRFTQEQIYNRTISPVLNNYVPYYSNVSPYGEATPNRTGVTLDVSSVESEKVEFGLQTRYLSEITGVGSPDKRSFIAASGGVKLGISDIAGFEKKLQLKLGGMYEKTTRGNDIDLSSMLADAGITYGIAQPLDLMVGMKYFTANGNENVPVRNSVNDITGYNGITVDRVESIFSFGIKLNFNEYTNFIVNYNMINADEKSVENASYKLNQLFMNFNLTF